MTDQDKDLRMRMSMLLDSDLDGRENSRLIDNIEADAELRSAWANYCQIGDVLRSSGAGSLVGNDFAAKVSAAIAKEPTVLAPKALQSVGNRRSRIINLSLAASLALVAVIVGKSVNQHTDVFQTASHHLGGVNLAAAKATDKGDNPADSQFNDYLIMHNETAYMAGSAAMLPNARLLSSGPGR